MESTTVSVVASCKACTAGRSSSPPQCPPAHDRRNVRGKSDHRGLVRRGSRPGGWDEKEVSALRAGGPMPDVSEIICPGVHELEDVVTAIGIGDVQRNGADREIDLRPWNTRCRC